MVPKEATAPAAAMKLPILVFGIVEVRRLKRELEALEEFMAQERIREPGKQIALPRVSRLLDALAAENHLNLLQPEHRQQLKAFLEHTEKRAPVIHMSFATDPSSAFTAKIVTWLRANISPDVLLEIGLQPTIAAGAILRTNNKIFDLSLRQRFAEADKLLLESFDAEAPMPATPSPSPLPDPALPVGLPQTAAPAAVGGGVPSAGSPPTGTAGLQSAEQGANAGAAQ